MNVEKMDGAVRNNSTEHFPSNALKYLQNVSCKTEVLSVADCLIGSISLKTKSLVDISLSTENYHF